MTVDPTHEGGGWATGRPRKRSVLYVHVDPMLKATVRRYAQESGKTAGEVVRSMLAAAFESPRIRKRAGLRS